MKQGNKHEENTGEHRRTSTGVSRMRYHEFHLNVPSQDTSGLGYFISVSFLKKARCKSISVPFFVSGWRGRLFPVRQCALRAFGNPLGFSPFDQIKAHSPFQWNL